MRHLPLAFIALVLSVGPVAAGTVGKQKFVSDGVPTTVTIETIKRVPAPRDGNMDPDWYSLPVGVRRVAGGGDVFLYRVTKQGKFTCVTAAAYVPGSIEYADSSCNNGYDFSSSRELGDDGGFKGMVLISGGGDTVRAQKGSLFYWWHDVVFDHVRRAGSKASR